MKKIKIFLNKKQRIYFTILFIGILISAGLEMVGVGSIPIFLNLLLKPDQLLSYLPEGRLLSFISTQDYFYQISLGSIIILLFFLFKNIFLFAVIYLQAKIFRDVNIENSKRLFQSYLNSPYFFHLNRNPAIIDRNVLGEVHRSTKFVDNLMNLIRESLVMIVIFILLLFVQPLISLAVFLVIGFFAVIFYFAVKKKMTFLSKQSQHHRGYQVQLINQVFGAIKDTKIMAREPYFINKFKNETIGAERFNFFSQIVGKTPRQFMEILGVIAILSVILLFIRNGHSVNSMIPVLGLLGIATIRLIPSFNVVTSMLTQMRGTVVSFNLVVNELTGFEKYSNKMNNFATKKDENKFLNQNIELQNITYKYPNSNKDALKNISFKIKAGNSVAIIGETGSGKSTLIDIILGLLEPSKGQITVEGKNINTNYSMWQRKIGYIAQDIYLIDDTIKRNIAFGIPDHDIDEDRIQRAIQLTQLSDFITDLDLGVNSTVGNRGIRLSGGQRQRIGIARALYQKTEILILDEATSSLDMETEKKLMKDIESLRDNYTLIVATHRLSTIKNCDEVFLLSGGKLVDQGHFKELASRHNEFKTIV